MHTVGMTGPELDDFLCVPPGPTSEDDAAVDSGSDMTYDSIGSHSSFTGQCL